MIRRKGVLNTRYGLQSNSLLGAPDEGQIEVDGS